MKPSIPKGVRDFLPQEIYRRNYIFNTIRSVFESFGYVPIETPTMENLTTLTGKYGDEGDKLLFKVLNNGDYLSKANAEALENKDSQKLLSSISKRGLRYDLTVPFARYVVQNRNDLPMPFKRYQMQPVWRADRPQRGRYHEFYQCDVDVVGSKSLMYEAELMQIYDTVFEKLGLNVEIQINNRKILYGIAESLEVSDKFVDMTVAIDKLDKIGEDGVINDLVNKGIAQDKAERILALLKADDLSIFESQFANSETGQKGIEELRSFHKYFDKHEIKNTIKFTPSLARGLSYYTGCIFEVKALGVQMGSIGGGGRYDDLTAMFGLKDVSGVGVSFGFERIYVVMDELGLFPEKLGTGDKVLIAALDEESHLFAFELATKLRKEDISIELYPEASKLKKQLNYANKKSFSKVLIIGETERLENKVLLKNMETGVQENIAIDALMPFLKSEE